MLRRQPESLRKTKGRRDFSEGPIYAERPTLPHTFACSRGPVTPAFGVMGLEYNPPSEA